MSEADQQDSNTLDFTGERYLPEVGGVIELEHLHRYALAKSVVTGKAVLDIASGEGYGSFIMSEVAASVVGVDIAPEAVSHASQRYQRGNLQFLQGSCAAIPLPDASVDVVVSFETIEHHDQHAEMFAEIARVLRPNGVLLMSSPDKQWYTDETGYQNPYHVKELYRDEFLDLVRSKFSNIKVYGQRVVYGSAILPEAGTGSIGSVDAHTPLAQPVPGVARPLYLIALASNADLPEMRAGLLEQPFYKSEPFRTLAMQYDERIAGMVEERQATERQLEEIVKERAEAAGERGEIAEQLQRRIAELEKDLETSRQSLEWAESEINRLRRSVPGRITGLSLAVGKRFAALPVVSPLVRQLSRVRNKLAIDRQYADLKDCPLFDASWYLEKNPDVRGADIDPLRHYLAIGWRERRTAGREFDDEYYVARNPDVRLLGRAPLWHYWMYGRHEGRHPNPSLDLHWTPRLPESGREVTGRATDELDFSVIIPTYNRKALLPGVLEAWKRVAEKTRFPYEIIFSDDGSEDGSVELLEQYTELPIRILRNQHGGASNARNAAIRVAKGKRLLIIGDDIFPDPMILNVHAELGKRLGPNFATLGVVDWHPELEVNHLMRHITEVGNEQFSFNRLKDGQCVDFRHFYTCNIAVDRDFLLGEKVIFDEAFHKYGFEDIELGYRLCMRGMRIYFTTAAKGDHFHPYRVDSFCRRQASAGEMAVVFRDMHAATSQILGIDSLQRAYERSKANSAEPQELWESRRDWLVTRCEFYENVITTLDGRPATFVTECLSEIYSRLFKAMYEYGVLLAITRHPEVIAFTMARNFPGKWNKLWAQMGRVERVTLDEAREALYESRFNMSGTEDDIVLADLKLIRQLAAELGSQVVAHRGTLHMLRRALHYLRHDPRYLAARVSSLFTPQLPGKPAATPATTMRTEPLTLAVVLRPGLADAVALEQRYRAAFTSGVVFYQADEAGQIRPLVGHMGQVRGDCLTEEMVYCPTSVASALSPDHLYMASLALALNGLDLAIVSHDLQDNGNLRCATLHDQAVFSGATFAAMQAAGGSVRGPLRGKLLRMLPAQDVAGMREAQLADVLGQDIEFESSDQLIFHHGDAARRASGFPAMQLPPSEKPVVFVLPVFLAVGGVERNTVEVMRQLRDRYDFVVITMERLRLEQGSLAAQASEVAAHVLELSEACAHGQYLDVLKQWKAQLRPDLVWICNGSPWLCDELGALRELFFDVPIVDQKVYDAQMGWITRYGDGATRTLDRFIAINKKIYQRFVADFRIDPARIDLIYSVIDASKFEPHTPTGDRAAIRRAFGLPEAKRTFVFMGRLVAQKRPLEFLRLAESRRDHDELYVLVGDGELASAAEDYIQETGLRNVVRIPYVANTADLFSVTDGLIVTSSYEGLPIAMLEAMAMGVPVLATDVGDIADVLADFDAGEVVPEANAASVMASRMEGWQSRLEHYRRSLSEKRDEMRKRFSSNSIAAQYEACWRAAANGYRGKARE